MIIIDITSGDTALNQQAVRALQTEHNIRTESVEASSFSSFTAMRIATALKKNPAEVIVCHRRKDLMSAISARKIATAEAAKYSIVYAPLTEEYITERLIDELTDNIDAVVVPAEKFTKLFSNKKTVVIPPTVFTNEGTNTYTPSTCNQLKIGWIGDIDEAERLDRLIRTVAAMKPGKFAVRVYGTGSPRKVMPIVKGARHIDNLDLEWLGDKTNFTQALGQVDIAAVTSTIATEPQILAHKAGIPMLKTDSIAEITDTLKALLSGEETLSTLSQQSVNEYNTRYSPSFHVEQWRKLLLSLRN